MNSKHSSGGRQRQQSQCWLVLCLALHICVISEALADSPTETANPSQTKPGGDPVHTVVIVECDKQPIWQALSTLFS